MITDVFFIVTAGFFIISCVWIWRISRTLFWLKKDIFLNNKVSGGGGRFFVLLPVLDEALILEETVEYFLEAIRLFENSKVVLITTEKEYQINDSQSLKNTIVLSRVLEKKFDNVISLHYPYVKGKMAHQVNYAVDFIKSSFNVQNNDFFALYNADSRPDNETFEWVHQYLNNNQKQAQVFQQYGNYLGNYLTLSNRAGFFLKRSILIAASMWQNRWSIGFEIPHALDQFKENRLNLSIFDPLNYCIGHGLFFSYDIYRKVGGFSEDMHNEDAIFGLKLSYYHEPIIPIPFFDKAYSPDSIKSLFFQKVSWFFGPLQAFEYYFQIIKKDPNIQQFRIFILSTKLFSHAIFWIFGPTMMVFLLVYALFINTLFVYTLFLLVVIAFLVFPSMYSLFVIQEKGSYHLPSRLMLFLYVLIGSIPFYILYGLSAWLSLFQYFCYKVFGHSIRKEKTIMIHN